MDKGSEVNVTNPAKAGLNTVKSSEFHFCIPVKFFSLFPNFQLSKNLQASKSLSLHKTGNYALKLHILST